MKQKAIFALVAAIIIGFGIPSTKKCDEATYVDTYLAFSIADTLIPGFDLCN